MSEQYRLRVNGREHDVDGAWLGESLLYVLRDRLGLPGSKSGCEQGECGSCSVLVDGTLVCSCLVLAASAVGQEVTTVEAFGGPDDPMSPVQEAFVTEGGVQCGFCTPGLVITVVDLLGHTPAPTDDEVRDALAGNLCRCTGYQQVLDAVRVAACGSTAFKRATRLTGTWTSSVR